MPSNQTPSYQLSQWSRDDRVLMDDFNADNAKIDAALGDHEGRVAALEAAAPHFGNCQIYATTYTGTGTCGVSAPNSLTFPRKPVWAVIFAPEGRSQLHIFPIDNHYNYSTPNRDYAIDIKWRGNTVSWYCDKDVGMQMNYTNNIYRVFAFCPLD